jgi:hypothetical protein
MYDQIKHSLVFQAALKTKGQNTSEGYLAGYVCTHGEGRVSID